ncbi:hypothetical protein QEZ54_27845 [Catellatospora sp. KI3]|uniref:hypothetical protein n=1 Tax=Catellatospora sp. KI3 TaxID=3041620 RepID=UPI002482DD6D|nr:hypothetical protein [Catellatospora sp. KI3]MDI1464790.1 hypothetical protein [Catellatospora sp. KI3]
MKRKLILVSGIVAAAQALVLTAAVVGGHAAPQPRGTGYTVLAEDKGPTVVGR